MTGFRGTDSDNISTTNRLLDPVPFLNPSSTASAIMGHPFSARQFKRGIPPLATKHATYGIAVPDDVQGPLTLSVRFRYRNLPPHLLAAIGVGDLRDHESEEVRHGRAPLDRDLTNFKRSSS